jgi:mannitol-1-phosphate 5-dehydrogenase
VIKGDKEEILNIKNVRGIYADDEKGVSEEIVTAAILAVSVGQNGLSLVLPLLAKGLEERYRQDNTAALDIIIAENMRNASDFFRIELIKYLPSNYPFDKLIGLIETSIGKMVPIMRKQDFMEDALQVFAEPYNTLILDKKAFKNPIPEVEGLAPKENMKAWVDRKLFIHNLGHASTAFLGYLYNPNFNYLYEALEIPLIHELVRATMIQVADILLKKYPDEFTLDSLTEHIDDLLQRFGNKALGDTIFRVGCDLQRKLGPDDRLVGAIRLAVELRLPYDKILFVIACGCNFRRTDEDGKSLPSDLEFFKLREEGIRNILTKVCGFDKINDQQIIIDIEDIERNIKSYFNQS